MRTYTSIRGFTLIEMMIVMLIIGVLAGIGIPQYNDYVRKAEAGEATSTLSEYRVRMEQFYQDNRSYGAAPPACGVAMPTDRRYFTFTCTTTTGQEYTLTATGNAGHVTGTSLHVYTLNHANAKTTTTFKGNAVAKNCWLISGAEC